MDIADMDVVLLCGGRGTRLQSVVPTQQKTTAEIQGRPFLSLLLEHLDKVGFRRFVVCVGYRAGDVEAFLRTFKSNSPIELSWESSPLGTGGALWNARSRVSSDHVLVLNGDSFCPVDYAGMVRLHVASRADATIAVVETDQADDYGTVRVNQEDGITAFNEKEKHGVGFVNAGVYVFRKKAVDSLCETTPCSLEKDVFPRMVSERLMAFKCSGPLIDIGTPERYEKAQRELLRAIAIAGNS